MARKAEQIISIFAYCLLFFCLFFYHVLGAGFLEDGQVDPYESEKPCYTQSPYTSCRCDGDNLYKQGLQILDEECVEAELDGQKDEDWIYNKGDQLIEDVEDMVARDATPSREERRAARKRKQSAEAQVATNQVIQLVRSGGLGVRKKPRTGPFLPPASSDKQDAGMLLDDGVGHNSKGRCPPPLPPCPKRARTDDGPVLAVVDLSDSKPVVHGSVAVVDLSLAKPMVHGSVAVVDDDLHEPLTPEYRRPQHRPPGFSRTPLTWN